MSKQIEIYVDDSFFDLVPRPTKEQRKALKESIQNEGQHEPIIVDSSGRILDGHTRFEICQELHLKPKYVIKDFKSEDDAKRYAVTVNLKRRHLNDYQIFELLHPELEKIREQTEIDRRKRISDVHSGNEVPLIKREYGRSKSIAKLSEIVDVKMQTLEQCNQIYERGDEKLKKQLREGQITPRHAYAKLRKIQFKETHKAKYYRSRFGIAFEILKSIRDIDDIKISELSRSANLSHYATREYLDLMIKSGLVIEQKETKKYKYIPSQYQKKWFELTDRGVLFLKKCLQLYEFLPEEFASELIATSARKYK